jgi:threonine dehydrogenase-like Zn-dependent dehydrogenase
VKAIVLAGDNRVALEERPEPRVEEPGDAVVRVTTAGICGSDLHIVEGRDRSARTGTVMGHELVGVVEEVGAAVTDLQPGQRVVSPFSVSCGRCYFCRRDLPARCELSRCFGVVDAEGRGLEGAQAERVRVPLASTTLVPLPELRDDGQPLPDEEAILLGDVFATGYSAARRAGIESGDIVAVVGCGPVGLLAALSAALLGARAVVASDMLAYRREAAARLGALPAAPHELQAACEALTDGRGADAVVEAVGTPRALDLAIRVARAGATIAIAGYHTEATYPLPMDAAYQKNLSFRIGRTSARSYIPRLLPMLVESRVSLAPVVSHVLPLEDGVRGYKLFARKEDGALKVLLRAGGSS